MAEKPGELRQINWETCFPFTRLFKSFGMAIQPNKLVLALAGIVLMGIWGGVLDKFTRSSVEPMGDEIWAYWQVPDIYQWRDAAKADRLELLKQLYGPEGLLKEKGLKDSDSLNSPKAVGEAINQLKDQFHSEADKIGGDKAAIAALSRKYVSAIASFSPVETRGIFKSFLRYEQRAVGQFLDAGVKVLLLDVGAVTRGTHEVIGARYRTKELRNSGVFGDIGMIGAALLMLRGVQWMVVQHLFYALLFGLGSMAIWALFGGAVCRTAALAAARDEQLSWQAALAFSSRKFLAFFSAPLLPVIMIVGIGALLWLGGFLVMQVPYVGELIGGPLMILALVGGFVMAMILVGGLGGGGLLWPTIAVEGTDGFDAMSRSYAYFYSRPWRLAFYSIVATAYAGMTYTVLRYFVFIVLRLTRLFVAGGAGVWTSRPGAGDAGAGKMDAIWPIPLPGNLLGQSDLASLGRLHWDAFGSMFVWLYVMILVLLLCAYLVSFFFCAGTIIYSLLRQKVDGIDYEDVFVEDRDDESAVPTPSPVCCASTGGAASVATPGLDAAGSETAPSA